MKIQYNLTMTIFPFSTRSDKANNILIEKEFDITFSKSRLSKLYSYSRSGIRIGKTTFSSEKPLVGDEAEIIQQIHAIRFNPNINQYVITGGHFTPLFVRNLGIFYNALLDYRIPSSQNDWLDRQKIVLQTVALDLEIFRQANNIFTTIVPLKENSYTCLNIYSYPSDSLYAILYTLCALSDESFIARTFPFAGKSPYEHSLQTKEAAKLLLSEYKETLKGLLKKYTKHIIDPSTGLVRKDILLSSARDGIKRQSSFYDNVIYWVTVKLASQLELCSITNEELEKRKENIIKTFWNEQEGIFLDDLSEESQRKIAFSADSLIVSSTGFLSIKKEEDRRKLLRIVSYVKKNNFDKPFPLRYSSIHNPKKLYRPVRYFAPVYMTNSIWSHWGMEFIKVVIQLSSYNKEYLQDSLKYITSYKENIERFGGYAELYDLNGNMLRSRAYKSVLHNGWVINYEQVKAMYQSFSLSQS